MYILRPYQERGLADALTYIASDSIKKVLMVAPVGSGKSLYIASIANALRQPLVVFQPTKELLKQNYDKYISYGNKASIYCASLNSKKLSDVTFATIQSLIKEVNTIKSMGIRAVLIDEAHLHSKNNSLLATFLKQTGINKVIGLTATPIETRSAGDKSSLVMITNSQKNMFEEIIHVTQIQEIINNNYWANIKYDIQGINTSMLVLNKSKTDYTQFSLSKFFKENSLQERVNIAIRGLQRAGRKSILIFGPCIAETEALCSPMNIPVVHSKLSTKRDSEGLTLRDRLVKGFKNLSIPAIGNVNILGTGFDHPQLDAIVPLRPTYSLGVHYQQLGRIVRKHLNKKDGIIVDFSGNIRKFGKLEDINFKQSEGRWGMFSGDKQLTTGEVFRDRIKYERMYFGKYNNMHISRVPVDYLYGMLETFVPRSYSGHNFVEAIKKELEFRN